MTGNGLALPSLSSVDFTTFVSNNSTITLPALASVSNTTFAANSGGKIYANASSYTYSSTGLNNGLYTLLSADGAGSDVNLSGMTSLDDGYLSGSYGYGFSHTIQATNGGTINLSGVTSIKGPSYNDSLAINLDSTGGSIKLNSLTDITHAGGYGFTRFNVNDNKLDMPVLSSVVFTTIQARNNGEMTVGDLVAGASCSVSLTNGSAFKTKGGLTSTAAFPITMDAISNELYVASDINFSNTMTIDANTGLISVGGNLLNRHTLENDVNLAKAIVHFTGTGVQQLEVGGLDVDLLIQLLTNSNFGIGQLVVGQYDLVGQCDQPTLVQLVENVDNGNRASSNPEALYLFGISGDSNGLRILGGSILMIGELNVYADVNGTLIRLRGLFGVGQNVVAFDHGYIMLGNPSITHPENMILNGGFESGTNPPTAVTLSRTLANGSTDINAWSIAGGGIDWCHDALFNDASTSGQLSVDLSPAVAGAGIVQQTISTLPGYRYFVWFDMGFNPLGNRVGQAGIKKLEVRAGADVGHFTIDSNIPPAQRPVDTNKGWTISWQKKVWSFVAMNTNTTIEFVSTDTPPTAYGAAVDNVVVIEGSKLCPLLEGNLHVTLGPAGAISAGAQWNVDGGAWQDSGATVSDLSVGPHDVNYKSVTGWTSPTSETIDINDGQTTSISRSYTQLTRIIGLSGNLAFGDVQVGQTATRTLTISNSGNSTLAVSGISYPSGFSGAYSGNISAGGSTNVTVTFAPTSAASYGGTITVNSDKTSGTNTISTSGNGISVPTRIIGLSGNLAFGDVQVGQTATRTLTISNSGNSTLAVSSISYPSGFSGAYSGNISAGGSANVTVTFAPISATSYSGTITVNSDKTSGTNTINASGNGISATTRIIGLSGNIAFGDVQVGQTATRTLTISNSGNSTLAVSSIAYPSGFSGAYSGNISAGGSTNVTVTFAPTSATGYSGTITVNSDKTSGTNTINASGNGIPAPTRIIGLSGNLAFGDVQVGQTSTRTLTISNSGNSTLAVSSISYPSGFSGAYSGNISAGGSTNVTVTFAPTSATSYSGTITVNSDKTSGTNTISTSGNGISVPTRIIGLSGNMAFDDVQVGQTATRTLTISNSGNSTLAVSGISYPSGFSGAYSGNISAGGSTNVTVTFAPTSATGYSGTITVNSDNTSGTNTINASGTGIPQQTGSLQITKCAVTAGKGTNDNKDSIAFSGTIDVTPADIIGTIDVKIGGVYQEKISSSSFKVKKGKYTYTYRIPRNGQGGITSLVIDTNKKTFALKAQKVNLTGLSCPFDVEIGAGSYRGICNVNEDVVNGKQFIPIQLMSGFEDDLQVQAIKVTAGKKPSTDSLSAKGGIAFKKLPSSMSDVVLKLGGQTFTIPAGSFKPSGKSGLKYVCKNAVVSEGGTASATFDFAKCIFTLSINNTTINSASGKVDLNLTIGSYSEGAEVNF